jgi:type II secretion system protein N
MKDRLLKFLLKYGKYGSLVGYPAFYLVCLAVFASLTFPYDKLKERIVCSFNDEQRAAGGQLELQVDSLSGYWLSGVRMTGVQLLTASSEPGKPPSRLAVDEATVRYALFGTLIGNSDIDFSADVFGGTLSGSYDTHGKDKELEATLEDADVGKVTPLVGALGVPLEGKLKGTLRLKMPEGQPTKASGVMSFESKATAVGDGKAKLKGALALPRIDVGTITLAADVKDGVVKLTKFIAGGKDLDLQGDGRITLRDQVADALCDVQVRFRINDAYRVKNDLTKSLFGTPGSTATPLFELDPKVKQSKRADGFYGWSVRGPVAHLDFAPAQR